MSSEKGTLIIQYVCSIVEEYSHVVFQKAQINYPHLKQWK
jgi:hypothetical protein